MMMQEMMLDVVEQTSLPKMTVKARGGEAQLQAYVNAYIVGERQVLMANGARATPLYYLSLVGMRGQGTTLQGIFSRLVSTHTRDTEMEGIGEVALAPHQALFRCGYPIHWQYEQAEILPTHDLHAVIESRMLTMADPIRGFSVRQRRERRTAKQQGREQGPQGKRRAGRTTLSTVKQSKTQQGVDEVRQREVQPVFLLLVPGWHASDQSFVEQLHLTFLDPRLPWPLDPCWAHFLWERGCEQHEIERLKVWCAAPAMPTMDEEEHPDPCLPLIAEAYFCRPHPERLLTDLQQALASGLLHPSSLSAPAVPDAIEEEALRELVLAR